MRQHTSSKTADKPAVTTAERLSETSSSRNAGKPAKPAKPYPDFPLTPHPTGRWCKKIRGKTWYFGKIDDPDAALKKYLEQKDDLHAGRKPRVNGDGFTVRDLVNLFLNHKRQLVETGELAEQTFREYHATGQRLIDGFGRNRLAADIRPEDFAALRDQVAKRWGPVRLLNEVQRVRSVFKFGYEAGHLDRPMRFGPGFKRPSRKTLRLNRAAKGPKMFEPEQIHQLLGAANPAMKAMILLGVNCGFGNADCANLSLKALDLDAGMANYPRPKTGIDRRCPLWPETVQAVREALAKRPEPKDAAHAGLVFVTKQGNSWRPWCVSDSPISKESRKLLDELGIRKGGDGRDGLGFYALRHTFETIGGESRDQVAVDFLMGHARDDMASHYRERISDERLKAVTDSVRAWLFAPAKTQASEAAAPERTC